MKTKDELLTLGKKMWLELSLTGKSKKQYFKGFLKQDVPINECYMCEAAMIQFGKRTVLDCDMCGVFIRYKEMYEFDASGFTHCSFRTSPYNAWCNTRDKNSKKKYAKEVYDLIAEYHRKYRRRGRNVL
jgi:hypothetical protein